MAVRHDHADCAGMIRLLLQSQADPLAKSTVLDRTPLHLAAMNENVSAVQELLLLPQADTLLTAVDVDGLMPFQKCRSATDSLARDMMLQTSTEMRHKAEQKVAETLSHLQLMRAAGITDGDTSRAEKQISEAHAVVDRLQTLEALSGSTKRA
eukprot:2024687-Prymnesium_polylepis.1